MNPPNKPLSLSAPPDAGQAEETLRMIARLPTPAGLEERLHATLRLTSVPPNLLTWPMGGDPGRGGWTQSNLARRAAAAAIVFVVVGGGWGVYTRVHPAPAGRVIEMPRVLGPGGGFSTTNAIRTPQTLNGPVLLHPAVPAPPASRKGPAGERAKPHPAARLHPGHKAPAPVPHPVQ